MKIHTINYGGPHGEDFVSIDCIEKTEYDVLKARIQELEAALEEIIKMNDYSEAEEVEAIARKALRE